MSPAFSSWVIKTGTSIFRQIKAPGKSEEEDL